MDEVTKILIFRRIVLQNHRNTNTKIITSFEKFSLHFVSVVVSESNLIVLFLMKIRLNLLVKM